MTTYTQPLYVQKPRIIFMVSLEWFSFSAMLAHTWLENFASLECVIDGFSCFDTFRMCVTLVCGSLCDKLWMSLPIATLFLFGCFRMLLIPALLAGAYFLRVIACPLLLLRLRTCLAP